MARPLLGLLLVLVACFALLPDTIGGNNEAFNLTENVIQNQIAIKQILEEQTGIGEGIKSLLRKINALSQLFSTKIAADERCTQGGEHKDNVTHYLLREVKDAIRGQTDIQQQQWNKIQELEGKLQKYEEIRQQQQMRIQQHEDSLKEKEDTIRVLEDNLRQTEEAAAGQYRKLEVNLTKLLSEMDHLAQYNEEVTKMNTQLRDNNTLLKNLSSACQHSVTESTNISSSARDCTDIQLEGETQSGVYQIFPESSAAGVSVLCKMQEDHMWTVFLARRRHTPQENFARNWQDYKTGFGDPRGEYWLGNDNLHTLTSGDQSYRLRVVATNLRGEQRSADWETFSVGDETSGYPVTVKGYSISSTLGDALAGDDWVVMDGMSFSTVDMDHDTASWGLYRGVYSKATCTNCDFPSVH
ncbi:fibrinogen-like protein 1 isoform X1 [Cherax quadricarinatus]